MGFASSFLMSSSSSSTSNSNSRRHLARGWMGGADRALMWAHLAAAEDQSQAIRAGCACGVKYTPQHYLTAAPPQHVSVLGNPDPFSCGPHGQPSFGSRPGEQV